MSWSWPPPPPPPRPEKTTAARAMDAACDGAVRRMVNLPRSVVGEVSRALSHGLNLLGNTASRRDHLPPTQPQPPPPPPSYYQRRPEMRVGGGWRFLETFENEFGTLHPFFYTCSFGEVLRMGEDEGKPVFIYLHSSPHPFTSDFCRRTLCSEPLVQFFDANFLSWGAFSDVGEGLHLAHSLRPSSFPFSAFLSSSSRGTAPTLLRQMEGPISINELIEIGQSIVGGERGDFVSLRDMREEEKKGVGELLLVEEGRKEKDKEIKEDGGSLNFPSLQIHQEQDVCGSNLRTRTSRNKYNTSEHTKEKVRARSSCCGGSKKNSLEDMIQMLIRLPNGERREECFYKEEKISSIYDYIDALGLPGLGAYTLVSYFPRRVFDPHNKHLSLLDAGFHPRATLFVKTDTDSSPST